ncbi:MAG: NAD(P)H-hydrate dehydratase [Rhodospirillales bacterium]|nr:NAD(P)H-hydrate dehydratase [Rhodospirillales bacterium]
MRSTTLFADALLTVAEMYRADSAAVAAGVPSLALMEAAGAAIVREIRRRWRPRPVTVLCGPGNNGGDGFVAARLLAGQGWPVRLCLLGDVSTLRGDAAVNAARWAFAVHPLDDARLEGEPLIVDALFGAGLSRAPDGPVASLIDAINRQGLDCIGVDVPSGVHGDTGAVLGTALTCRLTVTFFRRKPGHLLLPGRERAGEVIVADISIPAKVLDDIRPTVFANAPALWLERLPRPGAEAHKYTRGHALIAAGTEMSGAARLAADAARRIGAGLVSVAAHPDARGIIAAGSPGTIVATVSDEAAFDALLADPRRNTVLLGPGAGASEQTRRRVLAALVAGKSCVFDADALTSFRDAPRVLFDAIASPCVLTPHEGEFARLFRFEGDKLTRARAAAAACGAVVVLKGADTVIADPGGRAAINEGAPPELATAGSGDVLAGMVAGLLAQGLLPFDAACAAAWIHGRAAAAFGAGLIAEDVIGAIPQVLTVLRTSRGNGAMHDQ